jgi:hypothetical protein
MRQKKLDAVVAFAKQKDARAAFGHRWIPPRLLFALISVVKRTLCKS